MRRLLVAMGITICACSGPAAPEAVPAVAPTPAPVAVAPPPSPSPDPGPRRPPPLGVEQARAQARLLREARRAARASEWDVALARWGELVRASPLAPRLACEAGLVAHRAGRTPLAARRIDLALRLFGDPDRIDPALRVPLAMCLYNRGLVHEAEGDPDAARDDYDASLALRPNDTVRARRDALAPGDGEADLDRVTIAGVTLRALPGAIRVETTDELRLAEVMVELFAGANDFDEGAPTEASVARVGILDVAGQAVRTFRIDDGSVPLSNERLAIAFSVPGAFLVLVTDTGGGDNTDHGVWGGCTTEDDHVLRVEHGLLRVEHHTGCSGGSQQEYEWAGHDDVTCFEDVTEDTTVTRSIAVCTLGTSPQCVELMVGESIGERGHTTYTCVGEDDQEIDGPPDTTSDGASDHAYEIALEVLPERRASVRVVSGTPREGGLRAGEHGWDALLAMGERFRAPPLPEPIDAGEEE